MRGARRGEGAREGNSPLIQWLAVGTLERRASPSTCNCPLLKCVKVLLIIGYLSEFYVVLEIIMKDTRSPFLDHSGCHHHD